jgi:hypothetical protein
MTSLAYPRYGRDRPQNGEARGVCQVWVLPDDGIIDPIAIEIAASGSRSVALTAAERIVAAAVILARGGTPYLVSKRLHVSDRTALALAAKCQQQAVARS